MSDTKKTFYLTTPIYYVNARPHIGHAYTTIAADVIARRHRLLGDDTFFLTGTDEHGQKIERSATAAGIPPQQFADQVSAQFESLWKRMGITNDDYIRTTEERHKKGVQKLWSTLIAQDKIYLSTYTGQYSVGEEMFIDGPPGTIGPDGKPTETVTEENYFFRLSDYQSQLIDLIESGELSIQPEVRKNEVLSFLRGNVAAAQSTSSVNESRSERVILSGAQSAESKDLRFSAKGTPYVPGALKDLSISRSSFKWGIPVPGDEKHVIYVWLDALANYMTAIGYGSDDPADQAKFEKYWPADLHLVGKEIIRFHCVYWPAFLLAANLPLPKAITAHGWLLFEDSKMSKSRGNIVRTETILDAFGTLLPNPAEARSLDKGTASATAVDSLVKGTASDTTADSLVKGTASDTAADSLVKGTASAVPQETSERAALAAEVRLPSPDANAWKHEQDLFASDVLRYFLLREIPFGQDGSFSFDALVQRYNSDLANGYGNLVSRTLTMIEKYCSGAVPMPGSVRLADLYDRSLLAGHLVYLLGVRSQLEDLGAVLEDRPFVPASIGLPEVPAIAELTASLLQNAQFDLALERVNRFISGVDAHITATAPWNLAKSADRRNQLEGVLYIAAESIRIITALLHPILPYATTKVWAQLGLDPADLTTNNQQQPATLQWGGLKPGTKLGPLSPIFPRAPKELIQIMIDMETATAPKPAEPAALPQVNIEVDNPAHTHTEFRESPISSESATASMNAIAETTHPIAAASAIPDTPQIAIDDFVKIDLRVARILVAERIPKADKLLRLEVDLGYEKRQILSGIAQWYTPEELIGRNIVVIANLAPRKMRGLESHGMLLAASHGEDGKPVLATFGEDIALGSRLK